MFQKVMLAMMMMPTMVFADSGHVSSEFYFQPGDGNQNYTVSLLQSDLVVDLATSKYEESATVLSLLYSYGINESMALGVELSYGQGTFTQTGAADFDKDGLEDLLFLFDAFMPIDSGKLRYGSSLSFAWEDEENDSRGDANRQSGGIKLTPYVGFETTHKKGHFGAQLSQELEVGERSYNDRSAPEKGDKSGSNKTNLIVFYEHAMKDNMRLGASLRYTLIEDEDRKPSTGGSVTSEALSPKYALKLYLPTESDIGTFLPSFTYETSNDDKTGNAKLDDYAFTSFEIAYRF